MKLLETNYRYSQTEDSGFAEDGVAALIQNDEAKLLYAPNQASDCNTDYVIFDDWSSPQKKLLIVFAYINQKIGTRSHSHFLGSVNCKKLFLNPGANHWYQSGIPGISDDFAGIVAFVSNIKANNPDHEVYCLGHSMGAYAALGVGLAIGADRILASVPEIILNRPGSISIRCLTDVSVQLGNLTPLLLANRESKITCVVGRNNPFDMEMAQRLGEMPLTEIVSIDSGHETFPLLRDVGKLSGLMSTFVDGGSVPAFLENI